MIGRVLIPPSAGVFSAYGLLYSDVAYQFTKTRKALLAEIAPTELSAILGELEMDARTRLAEDGFSADRVELTRRAALHYQGQSFELEVSLPAGAVGEAPHRARRQRPHHADEPERPRRRAPHVERGGGEVEGERRPEGAEARERQPAD